MPIPFTVKIRLLPKMEDTLRLCKMLEREGAQLITVISSLLSYQQIHGRTRDQNKEKVGACDWKAIKQIRDTLSIPVFANGGICTLSDVTRCLKETGVNGVMVGEAILENPALFVDGVDPVDGHLLSVVEKEPIFDIGRSVFGVPGFGAIVSRVIVGDQSAYVQTALSRGHGRRDGEMASRCLPKNGRFWRR